MSTTNSSVSLPAVIQCPPAPPRSSTQADQLNFLLYCTFWFCSSLLLHKSLCCRKSTVFSGGGHFVVDALCFGKAPVLMGLISQLRLVSGGETTYLTTAWKSSPPFVRNARHRGHLTLLLQQCSWPLSHWLAFHYTQFQVQGYKMSTVLFLLTTEQGRRLVHSKACHVLVYLVIKTKHSGAKERLVYLRASHSDQPPCCKGISCLWNCPYFTSKKTEARKAIYSQKVAKAGFTRRPV